MSCGYIILIFNQSMANRSTQSSTVSVPALVENMNFSENVADIPLPINPTPANVLQDDCFNFKLAEINAIKDGKQREAVLKLKLKPEEARQNLKRSIREVQEHEEAAKRARIGNPKPAQPFAPMPGTSRSDPTRPKRQ